MKKYFYFSIFSLFVVIFIFAFLLRVTYFGAEGGNDQDKVVMGKINTDLFLTEQESLALLADLENNKLLPVEAVDIYPVAEAEAVAVFIPQTHKNPGTDNGDSINDSAEAAQAEIYDTLKYLHEQMGINFIMVEGEEFGLVSEGEIEEVAQRMAVRDEVAANIVKLKQAINTDAALAETGQAEVDKLEQAVARIDRDILLEGAPFKLKVEADSLIMYGAENPQTHDECAGIVRDYVYQKDQLAKVQSSPSVARSGAGLDKSDLLARLGAAGDMPGGDLAAAIQEKIAEFKARFKEADLGSMFMPLDQLLDLNKIKQLLTQRGAAADAETMVEQSAGVLRQSGQLSGNREVVAIAEDLEGSCRALDEIDRPSGAAQDRPSRSDNPYAHIQDRAELESLIAQSEQEIQANVIDRRNLETAQNFKAALIESGEKVGILQYGAGHEEGLIQELNKLNISVLVVKTDEIVRREIVDAGK